MPSLASDANFTAYWGNANAGMPSYVNDGSVWDGYFGVYHLEGGTGSVRIPVPMAMIYPQFASFVSIVVWNLLLDHFCS